MQDVENGKNWIRFGKQETEEDNWKDKEIKKHKENSEIINIFNGWIH